MSNVNDPKYAQPLFTALQIALVDLFSDWDIFPTTVVGHSSGEIAAAYCAGGLSRESAWRIAYYRGSLMTRLAEKSSTHGSMIAISLSEPEIQQYFTEIATQFGSSRLAVGCVNSPANVTETGDEECVDALKVRMDSKQNFARKLQVNTAYHSQHMNLIASKYLSLIQNIVPIDCEPAEKKMPVMISSVTGLYVPRSDLSQSGYWVDNLVSKVRFSEAISQMWSYSSQKNANINFTPHIALPHHLIEIGPHSTLRRPIMEILSGIEISDEIGYDSALAQGISALQSTLNLAGHLYCKGHKINITAINSPELRPSNLQTLSDLPKYPFNHAQSYWLESRFSKNFRFRRHARHELLGLQTPDQNPLEAKWRNTIRLAENPWIKDHKVSRLILIRPITLS